MKSKYKFLAAVLFSAGMAVPVAHAQTGCPLTATTNLHGYGCGWGDQIDYFELDGTSNSTGCASNGYYTHFSAPAWTLQIGQTYTWAATVGNGGYDQGLAIWIDLNNDGFFTSNEQVANSPYQLNHSGSFMVPFSGVAGAGHRMRVRCDYYTNIGNTNQTACEDNGPPNYNFYYGETEDYDVYLLAPPPCTGTPAVNSVVGPGKSICPGTSTELGLSTTYSVGGITYQWQSSTTSSVGPWTNVSANPMTYITAPLTTNTWYQAVITCTNSNLTTAAAPTLVEVQGVVVDSIPYVESFEGITKLNELPNCSWAADNLGSEAFTYTMSGWDNRQPRTGNNFASFYYWPGNTNSFYTNGIYLHAGVTYSASVWYITNLYGDDNWEDLSLLIGPNQNATGQMTIASTPGPAISSSYKSLSNTFTVAATGVYYVAVRTTVNTNNYAPYLSWDDLEIIIPCDLNQPQMNVTAGSSTICSGQPATLFASGVDNYLWSNGATGSSVTVQPSLSTLYTVTGTSSLTGCEVTGSHYITVNTTPFVAIVADKPNVCPGQPVGLTAVGTAISYNWSGSGSGNYISVIPQGSAAYSVMGTSAEGCSATASVQINVHPQPAVTASVNNTGMICAGDQVILTGYGAQSYQWLTSSTYIQTNPAVVFPQSSTSYSLIGTDANGCKGEALLMLDVEACTGLSESGQIAGLKLFPNPGTGIYTLQRSEAGKADITISDVVGRTVYQANSNSVREKVDISGLANGIYYLRISTGEKSQLIRVVKN